MINLSLPTSSKLKSFLADFQILIVLSALPLMIEPNSICKAIGTCEYIFCNVKIIYKQRYRLFTID